jgi:DNA-binding MarR family transcriptional regulator
MKNKKSYGQQNDLNLKTLIILSKSFQSVRKREIKTIQEGGLTIAQFGVLEILYHKGDLRIGDIIEGTLSTGGNMTVVVDNLRKEGLVSRKVDPSDKRASLIGITEKGKECVEQLFPKHVENISQIFDVLSKDEKEKLIQLLKKLGGVGA